MEKTFTVAGTSCLNGVVKFRFANDLKSRLKILERNGHTEIQLMELPTAMTKEQAIAWLENQESESHTEEQVIEEQSTEEGASHTEEQVIEEQSTEEDSEPETVDSIRHSLEADGEDTSEMSDQFLQEVADRENAEEAA